MFKVCVLQIWLAVNKRIRYWPNGLEPQSAIFWWEPHSWNNLCTIFRLLIANQLGQIKEKSKLNKSCYMFQLIVLSLNDCRIIIGCLFCLSLCSNLIIEHFFYPLHSSSIHGLAEMHCLTSRDILVKNNYMTPILPNVSHFNDFRMRISFFKPLWQILFGLSFGPLSIRATTATLCHLSKPLRNMVPNRSLSE